MGRIIFYEDRNFQGRSFETSTDCPELTSYLSKCQSCRVESGCFMVYDRPNYMGNQHFMRRGEYADNMNLVGLSDCIRSCRTIPTHRGQFRMRIYEKENLTGQMVELTEDCENVLERLRMTEVLSSQVIEGHWLLFEQPNFRGRVLYLKPGEHRSFREMGVSTTRFMSMKRIVDSCY